MINKIIRQIRPALTLGVVVTSLSAEAAFVELEGPNIIYTYDDTQAAVALFGLPSLVGSSDVVKFQPENFKAQSENTTGVQENTTVGANFVFTSVRSKNGLALNQIFVRETSDHRITNGDAVSLDLVLYLANNNLNPTTPFDFEDSNQTNCPTCYSGFYDDTPTASGGPVEERITIASANPNAMFATNPYDISLSIQNTLFATTDAAGETAWIQKKLTFAASTEINPIPLPASAWLFISALGLLRAARLKR